MGRSVDLSDMRLKLLAWLQKKMPDVQNLAMSELQRSGSGYSNETFLFELNWDEGGLHRSEGMVLRCQPKTFPVYPDYDLAMQARIIQCLRGTNIPVPRLLWLEEDKDILGGTPFYIMSRIYGDSPPEQPSYHTAGIYYEATPAQRARMWWGSLAAMANVHKLDWRKLGFSFLGAPGSGTDPVDRQLDYYARFFDSAKDGPQEYQPALEIPLEWLRRNRYVPDHVTLCWGDARMGNTIYGPDYEVRAILDWEIAFIGDPVCDLAWFLFLDWLFSEGRDVPRLEGTPGREETIRRYEELTGWRVKNIFYNDVMSAFRFAVIMFKVIRNFKKMGAVTLNSNNDWNNACTQRLASLLNLPSPGK